MRGARVAWHKRRVCAALGVLSMVLLAQVDGGVAVPDAGVVPSSVWLQGPSAWRQPLPMDPPVGPDRRFLEAAAQADGGAVMPNPLHPYGEGLLDLFFPDGGMPPDSQLTALTNGNLPGIPLAIPLGPEVPPSAPVASSPLVTGHAQEEGRWGRSVHTLTSTDIRQAGVDHMTGAQLWLPGTWPMQQLLGGGGPNVRGFSGSRTLVTLDGVRMNTAAWSDGFVPWLATVDPYALESVQVLNGSASTVHGGDAMGGVLALTTRGADHRGDVTVHAEGATTLESATNTRGVRLRAEGGMGPLSASLYGRVADAQDATAGRNAGIARDTRHTDLNLSAQTALRLGAVELTALYDSGHVSGATLPAFCRVRDGRATGDCRIYDALNRDAFVAGMNVAPRAFLERLEARVAYQRQSWQLARINLFAGQIDRALEEVHALTALGRAMSRVFRVGPVGVRISGGLEVTHDVVQARFNRSDIRPNVAQVAGGEDLPTLSLLPDNAYASAGSFYGLVEWDVWERVMFQTGVRAGLQRVVVPVTARDPAGVDRVFPLGSAFAQVLVRPVSRVTVGGGVHHGYHAPNIQDLAGRRYTPLGYEVPDAASARVEHALTAEGHASVRVWRFNVRGDVFATRWNGPPARTRGSVDGASRFGGAPVWQVTPQEDMVLLGTEVSARAQLWRHAVVQGQLTCMVGQGVRSQDPLSGSPPGRATWMMGWLPPLGFYAQASAFLFLPNRRRSATDLADPLYNQATTAQALIFNLGGGYQLTRNAALDLHVQNLTDEPHRLHGAAFPSPGINARAQLRLGF